MTKFPSFETVLPYVQAQLAEAQVGGNKEKRTCCGICSL